MLLTELYYIVVYNKLRWDVYVSICSDICEYGTVLPFLPIYHWGVTYLYIGVIPTIYYGRYIDVRYYLRYIYVTIFSYWVNTFPVWESAAQRKWKRHFDISSPEINLCQSSEINLCQSPDKTQFASSLRLHILWFWHL